VAPFRLTRESAKPHPTMVEGTQVMSMDKGSLVRALTVCQARLDDEFDVDPCGNTSDRDPKPIEELVKLQLGPKLEQCTQLSRDLTNHEDRHIADVLHRNIDLFAWQSSDMPRINPSIIFHKHAICPKAKLVSQKMKKKMREER